jgi:hypothetical protein
MAVIGLPTNQGLEILQTDLRENVKKFLLIGFPDSNQTFIYNANTTLADIQDNIAGEFDISRAFYDQDGVLTFECPLPYDFEPSDNKWIYAVGLVYVDETGNKTLVAIAETPRFEKIAGVGGNILYKVPVSGEPLSPVFSNLPYITEYDLMNLFLPAETSALWNAIHKLELQVQALSKKLNELGG